MAGDQSLLKLSCSVYVRFNSSAFSWLFLAACPVQFPEILRDSLEVLYLNDNQLECVPPTVCTLKTLSELYLSKWVDGYSFGSRKT